MQYVQFLVCRLDAIRPNGQMRTSEYFPMVVDARITESRENIVRMALNSINRGYVGMHEYIVVPMTNAAIVSFKPKQQYDVEVRNYA